MIAGPVRSRALLQHSTDCCRATLVLLLILASMAKGPVAAAVTVRLDETVQFDIPAQPLSKSLVQFGQQAHVQVILAPHSGDDQIARALQGALPASVALSTLLSGSGLTFNVQGGTVIVAPLATSVDAQRRVIRLADSAESNSPAALTAFNSAAIDTSSTTSTRTGEGDADTVEQVVVTGTLFHNVAPLSPLITFTQQDIQDQGYTRLDQVFAQLPQNFLAGASPQSNGNNQLGEGAGSNYSFGSGINLRGLGTNATLVLLNGQRISASNFGSSVDISLIPVSIIDRVEILTDGASATYGADAVAGVVNIITRNDFAGFEVGGRATDLSEGKAFNPGGHVLGGTHWSSGNFILNYDFEKDNPLYARDRPYTSLRGDPSNILPSTKTSSLYSAVRQDLSSGLTLSSTVLFGRRDHEVTSLSPPSKGPVVGLIEPGHNQQLSAGLQLDYSVAQWHASLLGHFAKEDGFNAFNHLTVPQASDTNLFNRDWGFDLRVDRPLFPLPGGDSRLALGGAFRRESIELSVESRLPPPASTSITANARHSSAAFGEVLLPLISRENGVPLIEQLTFDAALRFDHYSDFGSTTNPKFAVKWEIVDGLLAHAIYGRSFRAPTLYDNTPKPFGAYVLDVPDPLSSGATARILAYGNFDPRLQAERATSIDIGLTVTPEIVRGLTVDVSYFDIRFTNKIERLSTLGFFTNVLSNEAQLGELVVRDPSAAQIDSVLNQPGQVVISEVGPYNVSQIHALANIGTTNAASVHPRGVDDTVRYRWDIGSLGSLSVQQSASYYFNYKDQLAAGAAAFTAINQPYLPTRFRAKTALGWERRGWAVYSRANFANAYVNPGSGDPACPVICHVSSWTTFDAGVSYQQPRDGESGLRGVRVSLDVANAFNRTPPFVYSTRFINYDPTNASALQRAFSFTVSKQF